MTNLLPSRQTQLPNAPPNDPSTADQLLDTLIQHEIHYANTCQDTASFFAHRQFPGLSMLLNTQAQNAQQFAHELTRHQTPQPQTPPAQNPPAQSPTDLSTHRTNIDALCQVQLECQQGKHLAEQLTQKLTLRGHSPLTPLLHAHYQAPCPEQLWAINFIQDQAQHVNSN